MADTIFVRSTRTDGRVVVWERDDAHPDGEVYVAAEERTPLDQHPVVEVGRTAAVMGKLRDGDLEEVSGPATEPRMGEQRAAAAEAPLPPAGPVLVQPEAPAPRSTRAARE